MLLIDDHSAMAMLILNNQRKGNSMRSLLGIFFNSIAAAAAFFSSAL
tara:strand:+ start:1422 stop:1562 length:141 start_codon:yes stop_codon:yes gene_type:complete